MADRAGPRRFTRAELEQIEQLGERGLSCGQIGLKMDRDPKAISYHLVRLGLVTSQLRHRKDTHRSGRPVRSFTAEEDAYLRELDLAGLTATEMGRRIGERFPGRARRPNSIRWRLARLAAYDEASHGR